MSSSLLSRLSGKGVSRAFLLASKNNAVKLACAPLPFQTYAPLAGEKNALQKWGWEYLQQQKSMKRPIAPHLTVYQPQLTWMVSGAHRISGCVMGGVVLFGSVGMMVVPFDFTTAVEFVRAWDLPVVVTSAFKFIIAWPLTFHTLNGIRFLLFDIGKGMDNIKQVYVTGWTVLALATVIATVLTFWKKN